MTNAEQLLICVADASRNIPGITLAHKKAIEILINKMTADIAVGTFDKAQPFKSVKPMKLTMDMHSVRHNVKFSFGGVEFCKYSTRETFDDIRENVIESLITRFGFSLNQASEAWANLEVERG